MQHLSHVHSYNLPRHASNMSPRHQRPSSFYLSVMAACSVIDHQSIEWQLAIPCDLIARPPIISSIITPYVGDHVRKSI
jgi:hypothetical protein